MSVAPHRLKSCGRATDGTELEFMDAEGNILATGETGQIVIRGDLPTPGYYNSPEETAGLKRDGWHLTGDVGYRGPDGYVYIIDRLKEMIITGGFNVFPSEVEQALMGHEAIFECVVIGVPSEKWGEEVWAIVKLKPGKVAREEDLITFARSRVGAVRAPKMIELWEQLPKSASGKILRKKVREKYWRGQDRQV
ncbi:MAG: AMP-binding protein [Haliea sp.]